MTNNNVTDNTMAEDNQSDKNRSQENYYDIVVIGSGPAGQKAAVQAAKAGKKVTLIEMDKKLGGACVHRGTIPSKTLRENALRIHNLRKNSSLFQFQIRQDLEMTILVDRLETVVRAHDDYIHRQIGRNRIHTIHGRASFVDANHLEVLRVSGEKLQIAADYFVIATGSFPRHPENIQVDHENIYDSDSVLSMLYLPQTMTVLGSGVIATEYASIFASLGVRVTMIDRYPRPLGFLDKDLTDRFLATFEEQGGRFIGDSEVVRVYWDGISHVVTELADGRVFRSEKLLSAAGRIANVKGLAIEKAGLHLNDRGVIPVNDACQTATKNIFAAGDVIGPPSLASASMEQGRRAACAALGVNLNEMSKLIPVGIYAIPELSTVGMTAAEVEKKYGKPAMIGVARFEEIARGQISGITDGLLKLVADPEGKKLLGAQIVGEGATELIHIAQMGLLAHVEIDTFVENIFNFPTLAEAYRVAALHIVGQRALLAR
jgi:NAD(P) transhydrogenase